MTAARVAQAGSAVVRGANYYTAHHQYLGKVNPRFDKEH